MVESRGASTLTYTGRQYHFFDPKDEEIDILDIAHALSMQCRYNGHSNVFMSVAEHSVIVSALVEPVFALEALMHDAAEAYCGDMISPLRAVLPEFNALILITEHAIDRRFGLLGEVSHAEVKKADTLAYQIERSVLFPDRDFPSVGYKTIVKGWAPYDAKVAFLSRYAELTKGVA